MVRPAVEELLGNVVQLVEKEGMRARDIIFGLLVSQAVVSLGDAIAEPMLRAEMLARLESAAKAPDSTRLAYTPSFTKLPFEEAKTFFAKKQVMDRDEFRAVEDRYKAKGFTIAGVTNRKVLEAAHSALSDAIAQGTSEKQALAKVKAAFAAEGVAHPGDYHMQTVWDQAVLGSYAAGRYAQLTHPDVLTTRPYWRYQTAGDSRVRATHRAMDGRVFPADSDVWQTWFPPNGFRCRCGVVSLSEAEIAAGGYKVDQAVPRQVETPSGVVQMRPDPGFSGSPATQIAADKAVSDIREEAHGIGALTDTPADLNRAADVEREAKVLRLARMTDDQVAGQLRTTKVFNLYPSGLPELAEGELAVDWHMYSQNLDTTEQLVTRAVQERGLYGLRNRISIVPKATFFRGWDPEWVDPEVIYSDGLARKLGFDPAKSTVAVSTEYGLRFNVTPGELPRVLEFLKQNGERHGEHPVRRAWDDADVRIIAGAGTKLPEDDAWKPGFINQRPGPGGGTMVTLARTRLEGWTATPVAVNERLWKWLP